MTDFLNSLSQAVLDATDRHDVTCTIDVGHDITVSPDRAVPLAIIFTEALSNALEHGLPDCGGTITVTLSRTHHRPGSFCALTMMAKGCLTISIWRPLAVLACKFAGSLARQLDGTFDLMPRTDGRGARARLEIGA